MPSSREPWLPGSLWIRHFCAFCSLPKCAMEHVPRIVVQNEGSASETCKGCLNKLRLFNLKMRLRGPVTAISQWRRGCTWTQMALPFLWLRGANQVDQVSYRKSKTSAQCREVPNVSIVQEVVLSLTGNECFALEKLSQMPPLLWSVNFWKKAGKDCYSSLKPCNFLESISGIEQRCSISGRLLRLHFADEKTEMPIN